MKTATARIRTFIARKLSRVGSKSSMTTLSKWCKKMVDSTPTHQNAPRSPVISLVIASYLDLPYPCAQVLCGSALHPPNRRVCLRLNAPGV